MLRHFGLSFEPIAGMEERMITPLFGQFLAFLRSRAVPVSMIWRRASVRQFLAWPAARAELRKFGRMNWTTALSDSLPCQKAD